MNRLHTMRGSVLVAHGRRLPFGRAVLGAAATTALATLAALSLAGASAEAAFPGLNGRIICEGLRGAVIAGDSRSEIFSIDPDGSDEKRLTDNLTRNGAPAFSPDGKKIAFEGQREASQPDNSEVYVANNDGDLAGPDLRRLTFNNGELSNGMRSQLAATDTAPSWSPDGTQLVFHSGRETTFSDGGTTPTRDFEIYKMSATTGEAEQPAQRLTNSRGPDSIPSWSPDGTKIAFQRLYQTGNPLFDPLRTVNLEIWTMNPDGSEQTNVSNSPGSPNDPLTPENENSNGLDRDVIWSPNSAQLAFSSARDNVTPGNQNFEVYKMNRDGSNQTRLTSNSSGDTPDTSGDYDAPNTWSPDGRRILFTTGRSSTPDTDEFIAYTMDANAGESGGLQRVAETNIFARCDWQAVAAPPNPKPNPPGGGGGGGGGGAGASKVINGTPGNDTLNGTPGSDVINCGAGNDVVNGGGGDDVINCGSGNDRVSGNEGNDRIDGGSGNDRLSGNEGNDRVLGGQGNDRANGNSGHDRVGGNSGNDRVGGQSGNDRVNGDSGRDRVSGGSGNDVVGGQAGNDRVNGDSGRDRVSGGSGNDAVSGSSGNDRLSGGSGNDRLSGGSGNDRLNGGRGRDRLNGGRGRDREKQ